MLPRLIRALATALGIGVIATLAAPQSAAAATGPSLAAQFNQTTNSVDVYAYTQAGTVGPLSPVPFSPTSPCQPTRSGSLCTYRATDVTGSITALLDIARSATGVQFRWIRIQAGGSAAVAPLLNSVAVSTLGATTQAGNAIMPPQGGWPSYAVQINAVTSNGQTRITYTKPATCAGQPCEITVPGFVPIRLIATPSGAVSVAAP